MGVLDKNNIIMWDIESTKLNDIAYKLYLIRISKINKDLYERNEDIRASYTQYSNFIENKYLSNEYIEKAKIFIRIDKIDKIKNL